MKTTLLLGEYMGSGSGLAVIGVLLAERSAGEEAPPETGNVSLFF